MDIHVLTLSYENIQGEGIELEEYKAQDMTQTLLFKGQVGASLVAQWLRICLPMQGTWVRALVWEDPTCRGATGPVSHNY